MYKGQAAHKKNRLTPQEEQTPVAQRRCETTEDDRFIRKAHIKIDFDVLNAQVPVSYKASARLGVAGDYTLWGIVACLGLFSDPPDEADSVLKGIGFIRPLDGLSLYTLYAPNLPARAPYETVADIVAARLDQALAHETLEDLLEALRTEHR